MCFYCTLLCQKDEDWMTNSIDPDQTGLYCLPRLVCLKFEDGCFKIHVHIWHVLWKLNYHCHQHCLFCRSIICKYLSQLMRLWYLLHRQPAKAQASLRIRAVSPEPSLFADMKYRSRRRVEPKIRHLAPLDGCACTFVEWVYGGRKVP